MCFDTGFMEQDFSNGLSTKEEEEEHIVVTMVIVVFT